MASQISWLESGLYWKMYDNISGAEILEVNAHLIAAPRFNALSYQLIDMLEIAEIECSVYQMLEISEQDQRAALITPHLKIALVVTNLGMKALSALYGSEVVETTWTSKIFHTIDDAQAWLELGDISDKITQADFCYASKNPK